ncbi:unnamed protein product [Cylindrotheca closterium]|uniref:N-acetylgalactosaminide beta-1,3-galactosyltransferase n=1 Tax=Cylindrotheca closterium TaxID=2856 RepID=A0AAD2FLS8_9STRA|nr:unnamed protein product [Cylindrotheca closterium]
MQGRNFLCVGIALYVSSHFLLQQSFNGGSPLDNNNADFWSWSTLDVPITKTVGQPSKEDEASSTSLVDTTRQHPHAGARFPNGSYGYIADVTMVRQQMLKSLEQNSNQEHTIDVMSYLPLNSEELETVCNSEPREPSLERKAGWRLLRRMKVNETTLPSINLPPGSKLLCAIYTYEKKHKAVKAIGETWGWRCDGFFAASTTTVTDPTEPGLGAIDLPHKGKEEYENMWQKVRSIWAYAYDNYIEDFDYFYLAGDDTHVIVENLRAYLESLGPRAKSEPLYLGHWIPDISGQTGDYFCGGGAGYLLNKKALRMLVKDIFPRCRPKLQTHAEDRTIGECFRKFGILGNRSVDAFGSQLFHGSDPHFISHYKGDKGYYQQVYDFWGKHFGHKTGLAYHLLRGPMKMKRHHAIIYKSCPQGTLLGDLM